jgi:hypothetical protein
MVKGVARFTTRGGGLRVHVGDPKLVEELLEYFEAQADCVAIQVGEAEIEVALLGSYRSDRHAETVDQIVAQFRLEHPFTG